MTPPLSSSGAPAPVAASPNTLKLGRTLVHRLVVLLRTARLYDSANVNVRDAARAVAETIRTLHAVAGTVQLARILDCLTINEARLRTDLAGHSTFRALVDGLADREVGAIRFDAETSADDLVRFAREYHRVELPSEDPFGLLKEGIRRAALKTIEVEEAIELPAADFGGNLKQDLKQRSVRVFFRAIDMARSILTSSDPARMNFKKAKRVIHRLVDVLAEEESFLLALTMIKNYDEYTFNHSANVAVYSVAFGQRLGLSKEALSDLGMAALFHDVGKTRVPREILNKPGRLDPSEWEVMKRHAVFGAEMLLDAKDLTDSVVRNILVAFEHHLNVDLSGYPKLSDRRELNLYSKIVAICDSFDALTTPRVYRSVSYSPQEAVSILMEGRGTIYDPVLLKVFVNTIGVHPIGTLVELSSGEMGVVIRSSQLTDRSDQPFVKVFADATGTRVEERVVDLSRRDEKGEPVERITRTFEPGDYFDSIEEYLEIL